MGRQAGFFQPYRPTNPYRHKSGNLRVVVYMDDETYAEIDASAREAGCALSSQARMLIEIGLETLKIEATP